MMTKWLMIVMLTGWVGVAQQNAWAQRVAQIPSPRPNGWVTDQTETLSAYQQELINKLCADVQDRFNRELVVVVTDSIGSTNHRRFATDLFNRWRIGAKHKNQGILVFAAIEDRAAEIVLGFGIDTARTRREAQRIMDRVMIPKFKANDAGGAIYEGVHSCAKKILQVGELGVASKLPEILAEQVPVTAEKPPSESEPDQKEDPRAARLNADGDSSEPNLARDPSGETDSGAPSEQGGVIEAPTEQSVTAATPAEVDSFVPVAYTSTPVSRTPKPNQSVRRRDRRASPLPWVLGLGGVGLIGTFFGARYYLRHRNRTCDQCRMDRVHLSETQDDEFLDKPERIEESIGSVDYDVWACLECEDVIKLRYGHWLTRYSRCPDCGYITRFKIKRTIIQATTISGGLVEVEEDCKHCPYAHTYRYATPRIPKPSSGSRGGVFSSGSSGGSSSSGGGFSSGGGASGRW